MGYYQGFLIPVPHSKKDAYRKIATDMAPIFAEFGARRIVECWGVDVPTGQSTDMFRAVKAEDDDNIVFSWIDWGDKATCDAAAEKMQADERMQEPPEDLPFDGMKMIFAGFEPLGQGGPGGKAGFVQGYAAPAPVANREAVAEMCAAMRDIAIDAGALHAADGWAEDIADGKVTDFKQAVKAQDGEAIVFGWHEWADRGAFETGATKMQADKRMGRFAEHMPVDGKRMIFGGFQVILDTGKGD